MSGIRSDQGDRAGSGGVGPAFADDVDDDGGAFHDDGDIPEKKKNPGLVLFGGPGEVFDTERSAMGRGENPRGRFSILRSFTAPAVR